MGILDFIRSQHVDVIEWTDSSRDTLAWRFPAQGSRIKDGAQLTVREGQSAILLGDGQLADCFGPGQYSLTAKSLGFSNSPFKADIYFVNTRQYGELKWGTPSPIIIRDPDFDAVRVRARGGFVIQVVDPPRFLRQVVGTEGRLATEEIEARMRGRLVAAFTGALASSKAAVVDMSRSLEALAAACRARIDTLFTEIGLRLTSFTVEAITLPPEVEQALDRASGARLQAARAPAATAPPVVPEPVPEPVPAASTAVVAVCAKCHTHLPAGSRFCHTCGAPLSRSCTACRAALQAGMKFCGSCGAKVAAA